MRKVIHFYRDESKNIIVYQDYAGPEPEQDFRQFPILKTWEGTFSIDIDPTDINIENIIKNRQIQISDYFKSYIGIAHIMSVSRNRPIIIKFQGTGPLGKIIMNDDWISVNDILPEFDKYDTKYVLMSDGDDIWVGHFYKFENMNSWDSDVFPSDVDAHCEEPTHWKPLPKLPK